MYKKAQITYFILLALIIFIAAAFIVYINSNKKVEGIKAPLEAQPIQLFVESCIKNTGKDAVLFVSEHGGYYDLPNPHYSAFSLDVPYYFYQNLPFNPSKEQIEKQISNYTNENLFFCLRNFVEFRRLGYEIEFGDTNTKTNILPDKLTFALDMPIELKKENQVIKLSTFKAELKNVGLDRIISINNLILKEQTKNPNSICLTCILNWTVHYDLYVAMIRLDSNNLLFIIIDNNTLINQNPLEFDFINQYQIFSCSNLPYDDIDFVQQCVQEKIKNLTPELKIGNIPDFSVRLEEPFFYKVEATGKNVVFEDFTDLFDINPTSGEINFVPDESQIGGHLIWVKVKDAFGQEKLASFTVEIAK